MGRDGKDPTWVARRILNARPCVVVMETPSSGVWRGATESYAESLRRGASLDSFRGPPEVLAHAAALSCRAKVVDADRPKRVTYARLFHGCTAAELDESYSFEALRNYAKSTGSESLRIACLPSYRRDAFHRIAVEERDAIMAEALSKAVETSRPESVVAVVGRRHRHGVLRRLLLDLKRREKHGRSESRCSTSMEDWNSEPLEDNAWRTQHPDQYGAKRALFERVLAMATDSSVLLDARRWLGPMSSEEARSHAEVEEIYGSPRMLIASIPDSLRNEVFLPLPGQERALQEAIDVLQCLRPSNGGTGSSNDALEMLRSLHFIIS